MASDVKKNEAVIESRGFCIEEKCRSSVLVRAADEEEFMPRSRRVVAEGWLSEIARKRLKSIARIQKSSGKITFRQ